MLAASLSNQFIKIYIEREFWLSNHIESEISGDVDEDLFWGIRLFQGLQDFDNRLGDLFARAQDPETMDTLDKVYEETMLQYKKWLQASERYLKVADFFVQRGYSLAALDSFNRTVAQARWIVETNEMEGEIQPLAAQVARLQLDNPDPARYGI